MVINGNIEVRGMGIISCVLALTVPVFGLGYYIYSVLYPNATLIMPIMLILVGSYLLMLAGILKCAVLEVLD